MERRHVSLTELEYESERLAAELNNGEELPRIVRTVYQMCRDGSKILANFPTGDRNREQSDVQAAILLGSQGFNLPNLTRLIYDMPVGEMFALLQNIQPTDVDGYLRNERQNALVSAIMEHSANTHNETNLFIHELQQERWSEQKQRILSLIEFSTDNTSDDRLQSFTDTIAVNNLTRARAARDTIVNSLGTPIRADLSPVERKYARALSEYHAAYLCGAQLGELRTLVDKMTRTVEQQSDCRDAALLWRLLGAMQSSRLSAPPTDRLALLYAAKKFLEKKRVEDIRAIVYGNLRQASLGGAPATGSLIRAYLNVRPVQRFSPNERMAYGHPVWAVIYHALRCGDLACASEAANQAEMADLVAKFRECQRNPNERLSDVSAHELRLQYCRQFDLGSSTGNPYERVVLAVLAGCDVANAHDDIGAASIEDCIWIKMFKALVPQTQHNRDVMSLVDLQSEMVERYTSASLDALQRPLQYAYVLLLTAQFEKAIEFLCQIDAHRCHGVHIAIALDELALLNVTAQASDGLLTKHANGFYQINLPRLITGYTRRFEMTEPELALDYYYVIKAKHEALWFQCVVELTLETRAFAKLLGQRNPDGGMVHGALGKYVSLGRSVEVRNQVAVAVAEAAESRGLHEEAVALYELADASDKCVELLSKVLSIQVSQAGSEGSKRDKLQRVAHQVLVRYPTARLALLMDLMQFFDLYHAKKNDDAIQLVSRLRLIPLQMADVDVMVTTFCQLNEQVRRIIPDVLMALMTILSDQYRTIKRPPQRGPRSVALMALGGNQAKLELIKRQANSIIKYAGMVPYRLPSNINARLVQMEAGMA